MYDIAPSFWKQQVGDFRISTTESKKSGLWSENFVTLFFSLSDLLRTTNKEKVTAA